MKQRRKTALACTAFVSVPVHQNSLPAIEAL
jgi:hypothetical protein